MVEGEVFVEEGVVVVVVTVAVSVVDVVGVVVVGVIVVGVIAVVFVVDIEGGTRIRDPRLNSYCWVSTIIPVREKWFARPALKKSPTLMPPSF